jgi:hypothetical protein
MPLPCAGRGGLGSGGDTVGLGTAPLSVTGGEDVVRCSVSCCCADAEEMAAAARRSESITALDIIPDAEDDVGAVDGIVD